MGEFADLKLNTDVLSVLGASHDDLIYPDIPAIILDAESMSICIDTIPAFRPTDF